MSEDEATTLGLIFGEPEEQMLVMKDTQKVNVDLNPTADNGKPARLDGVPEWATSNPAVATVTPTANGLSAIVTAKAPGTTQISVTADVDLGPGVRNLTMTGDVQVREREAVTLGITFGTPEEQ